MHDIDVLTIGQKIVLEKRAGHVLLGDAHHLNKRRQQQQQPQVVNANPINQRGEMNNGNPAAAAVAHGALNNAAEQHNIAVQHNVDAEEAAENPNDHEDQVMNDEEDKVDVEHEDEGEIDPTQPLPYIGLGYDCRTGWVLPTLATVGRRIKWDLEEEEGCY